MFAILILNDYAFYRYGNSTCGHFECKYFLSYNHSGPIVDIELSARSPGWVAVGFSSDEKMVSYLM